MCVNQVVKFPRQKIKAIICFYNYYIYCWLCTNNGHPDGLDKSALCFKLACLWNFSQLFKRVLWDAIFFLERCAISDRFPHLSVCCGWYPFMGLDAERQRWIKFLSKEAWSHWCQWMTYFLYLSLKHRIQQSKYWKQRQYIKQVQITYKWKWKASKCNTNPKTYTPAEQE